MYERSNCVDFAYHLKQQVDRIYCYCVQDLDYEGYTRSITLHFALKTQIFVNDLYNLVAEIISD